MTITISDADRLFICNTPISMRKSFEGLSNVKGSFPYQWGDLTSIDRRQFCLLFDEIIPKKIQARFSL